MKHASWGLAAGGEEGVEDVGECERGVVCWVSRVVFHEQVDMQWRKWDAGCCRVLGSLHHGSFQGLLSRDEGTKLALIPHAGIT